MGAVKMEATSAAAKVSEARQTIGAQMQATKANNPQEATISVLKELRRKVKQAHRRLKAFLHEHDRNLTQVPIAMQKFDAGDANTKQAAQKSHGHQRKKNKAPKVNRNASNFNSFAVLRE